MKMNDFIKHVDFFSRDINLTKERSSKFSTSIGVVSSLVIIILTTLLMIYYFSKIYNCELQSNIIYTKTDFVPQKFIFKDYFPYIVRLEDYNVFTTTNTIVKIYAYYTHYIQSENGSVLDKSVLLNLTHCNISKFPEKFHHLMKLYSFENGLCVDFDYNPELNGTITIQGSFYDYYYVNQIRFSSVLCIIEDNDCLKNTSIKEQLEDKMTFFTVMSLDEIYDPLNYTYPSSPFINYQSFILSKDLTKYYKSYLTRTIIDSDTGIFLENYNRLFVTQNKNSFNENILIDQDPYHSFFYLDICGNKDVVFASRQYLKIQNAISLVIPVFNSLIMLVKFIVNPFINSKYSESIVNNLISLDFSENDKLLQDKISQNIEQLVKGNFTIKIPDNFGTSRSRTPLSNRIERGNKYLIEKKRKKKSKNEVNNHHKKTVILENKLVRKMSISEKVIRQRLFFSLFDYVKYYLFCMRNEKIQMKLKIKNNIEETLHHFTDLITLIKSFQEIEILKSLSLDERKKKIFQSTFNYSFNNRIGYSLIQTLLETKKSLPNQNRKNIYNDIDIQDFK